MSKLSRMQEVEQEFDKLSASGAYAEALDLVTREAHIFPDYSQKVIYSWRMTMASRLNDRTLTLQILKESIQSGNWYGGLDKDPDLQLLHGDPEFARLVKICQQRRTEAIKNAVPVIKIFPPEARNPPYPLLLALHGANAGIEADHWASAVSNGWLLALPQSSQIYAPGTYTWNDWEWAQQEVLERYTSICKENIIDPHRVVLAGFSQGGGLAAWLVLSGAIQARGLVLVGPFLSDVNNIIPLLEKHPPRGLKVYIAAGQMDQYCLGVSQKLADLLPMYGVTCKLDVYKDLEHYFPADFEKKLPDALHFVLSVK